MRISHEKVMEILDVMTPNSWRFLEKVVLRDPVGAEMPNTWSVKLLGLGVVRLVGRMRNQHVLTPLGRYVWDNHRPRKVPRSRT